MHIKFSVYEARDSGEGIETHSAVDTSARKTNQCGNFSEKIVDLET